MRGFKKGRLGLFIHLGLYSLLGGRWREQICPWYAEWIMHSLDIPPDEYAGLAKRFSLPAFSAADLAGQARRLGFHYICFTAKHHDGFALFDSAASSFNSVRQSPSGRDFVRELSDACRREGLGFSIYYSQAQDWSEEGGYRAYRTDPRPQAFAKYFAEKCLPQLDELLSSYGPIETLWLDTPMRMSRAAALRIRELVRKRQPNCLINGRIGHGLGDFAVMQDHLLPAHAPSGDWEVPLSLNHSFGYKADDEDWLSAEKLRAIFLRVVSRGGHLLLNLGPDGEGRIPEEALVRLERFSSFVRAGGEVFTECLPASDYVYDIPGLCLIPRPYHLTLILEENAALSPPRFGLPNILSRPRECRVIHPDAAASVMWSVDRTLEGDPYWRFEIPDLKRSDGPLILDIRIEDERVRYAPL